MSAERFTSSSALVPVTDDHENQEEREKKESVYPKSCSRHNSHLKATSEEFLTCKNTSLNNFSIFLMDVFP